MSKNIVTISVIFLISGLLSSCSSIIVSHDYDHNAPFSQYSNYALIPKDPSREADPRANNDLLNNTFNSAISRELQKKGFIGDTENADLLISYSFTIRPKMDLMNINAQVGFSYGSYFRYGGMGSKTCTDISEFDQGILVIDIRDAKTNSLVWRGTGSDIVSIHADINEISNQANSIASKILKKFPPKR
jgi:hypothetical protein